MNDMRKLIEAVENIGEDSYPSTEEYTKAIETLIQFTRARLEAEGATPEDGDALSDIVNEIAQTIWDAV